MTDSKPNSSKRPYRAPGLRVYGPMEQLTSAMWWGLYPDHLGNVQNEPTVNWAKADNKGMKGMKMIMTMS